MSKQAFDAIAEILQPSEPNQLGHDLLELYSEHPQDEPIVVLPFLTPRQFVQLVLILQEARYEEWLTDELQDLVIGLHDRIREYWTIEPDHRTADGE